MPSSRYTQATAWHAEGARVGLVICRDCGASILLDPRDTDNALGLHNDWHESIDRDRERVSGMLESLNARVALLMGGGDA